MRKRKIKEVIDFSRERHEVTIQNSLEFTMLNIYSSQMIPIKKFLKIKNIAMPKK